MSTLNTLETVADQAENAAENTARSAAASAWRDTGITAWANGLLANTAERQTVGRQANRRPRSETGVYILSEEEARASRLTGGVVFTAPDGYIRKSPVQEIVTPPDYWRQRLKKILLLGFGIAAVLLAAYALIALHVISL